MGGGHHESGHGHGHHGHGHNSDFKWTPNHGYPKHSPYNNVYRSTAPWMNYQRDPFGGWRYDPARSARVFYIRMAAGFGFLFGCWISWRLAHDYKSMIYPWIHPFHEGKYATQATHDNPFSTHNEMAFKDERREKKKQGLL